MVDTCKGDLKKSCRRLRGERFCYSRGGQLQGKGGLFGAGLEDF